MEASAYFGVLRRRWLAILVVVVASIAASISITQSTPTTYRASSRLFINIPAARGVQEALQGVELSASLMNTYARIATSRGAAQQVAEELDLHESASRVASWLSAEPEGNSLLIDVRATNEDPELAADLSNAAARVFIQLVDEFERDRDEPIEARLIDEALVPRDPVSPKPARNLLSGGIFGLLVGLAVALLLESLDHTVKTPVQAEASSRAVLLGVVPRRRNADTVPSAADEPGDPASEAFRSLRTALRFADLERQHRSVLVTSASPGEGKTTTAANLAVAFAQSGERVIVVDADLRQRRLSSLFGVSQDHGVMTVLSGDDRLDDALESWHFGLRVLPAGPLPPNPAEVCGSSAMADLFKVLETMADIVIIDAPPVLPVSDAVAMATQVDGVLLVARAGRTRHEQLEASRRHLDVVGANIIGCALVAVPRSAISSYWGDYRYTARSPRRPFASSRRG